MARKQLSTSSRLMQMAEAAGQSPEVYLSRMLNEHDTRKEAAEAIGVSDGAMSNYLAQLQITRLTSYSLSPDSNSPKAHDLWVPLWPESLIGGMGK